MNMNYKWAIQQKHYGSTKELGSLSYYFVLLKKKCLAGDKPDFHTISAAYDQILNGLVLNTWKVKCGSLEEFVKSKSTGKQFLKLAGDIFHKFGTPMEPLPVTNEGDESGDNDNDEDNNCYNFSLSYLQHLSIFGTSLILILSVSSWTSCLHHIV